MKTLLIVLMTMLTISAIASADKTRPITYRYSMLELNKETGHSQIVSEFEGKVKLNDKITKVIRREYVQTVTEFKIKGRNPFFDFEAKEVFPFLVYGLKNRDISEVFGEYHSESYWFGTLLGMDAFLVKSVPSNVVLRASAVKTQTFGDLLAPGHATLKISLNGRAPATVRWFKVEHGNLIELPAQPNP